MIGQTLSHYRITAALGAGGMGEVYRAADTRLGRDVAIKVLPSEVAEDGERLARFEREAKLLASLNHPNVAHVYGFESATLPNGTSVHFLAMELVEGEDLAERLKRGAIPVDEALEIAGQIAEGLEEAHEKGIVHRDLKPANIKLTLDGRVKVLDFGLAKAWAGDPATGSSSDLSQSPTLAHTGTQAGVILGTAAYMSPEQARGKPVDKRADIWAFGAVFFEMLTGRQVFGGETLSDVIAAVLTREVPWGELPADLPRSVHTSLRRCLERAPRRRLRDIGDVRLEGDVAEPVSTPSRRPWARALAVGLACAVLGLLAGLALHGTGPGPGLETTRLSILLPEDRPYLIDNWPSRSLAISPDGSKLAYVAADPEAENGRRLYVRSLNDLEPKPVTGTGTEGAHAPFFSPDGQWLAFFTTREGALRKVPLSGGPSLALTRGIATPAWISGRWSPDGWLAFDDWPRGLRVVPEDGGEGRLIPSPDREVYAHPRLLPGTEWLLHTVETTDRLRLDTLSVETEERRTVLDNASNGLFLRSGHLLYTHDGVLLVAPFDAAEQRVTGPSAPLPLRVKVDNRSQLEPVPQLAVSADGTLAYVPTTGALDRECSLSWIGRSGRAEPLGTVAVGIPKLQLSPDGTRLALASRVGAVVRYEVLRLDSMTTTLVDEVKAPYPAEPVWHPDGRHLVVTKQPALEVAELWAYDVEGETSPQRLAEVPGIEAYPRSFSPDGRHLTVTIYTHDTSADILIVDLGADAGEGQSIWPFARTTSEEFGGSFSPDGRFVAYGSDESGRYQVYVRRFPGGEGVTRVSVDGGLWPRWSPGGDEIYFVSPSRGLLASPVETENGLRAGAPHVVFDGPTFTGLDQGTSFDVAPDGRILVRMLPEDPNRSREIVVVQNWFEELERLAPAAP